MADSMSTQEEIINLADKLARSDPQNLYKLMGRVWNHIDDELKGYLSGKLEDVMEGFLKLNDHGEAYQYATPEWADKEQQDLWVNGIKEAALENGDHRHAVLYHMKQHGIRPLEDSFEFATEGNYYAAKCPESYRWLGEARDVALELDDYKEAYNYAEMQFCLYDQSDEGEDFRKDILSFRTIAEKAVQENDLGMAVLAINACRKHFDYYMKTSKDVEELVEMQNAIRQRAEEIGQMTNDQTLPEVLQQFKESFMPKATEAAPGKTLVPQ
jgi:hypothetical protein